MLYEECLDCGYFSVVTGEWKKTWEEMCRTGSRCLKSWMDSPASGEGNYVSPFLSSTVCWNIQWITVDCYSFFFRFGMCIYFLLVLVGHMMFQNSIRAGLIAANFTFEGICVWWVPTVHSYFFFNANNLWSHNFTAFFKMCYFCPHKN